MPSLVAPSHNALGVPTEIRFDASQLPSGKAATFPIFTFDQLDNMPLMTLKKITQENLSAGNFRTKYEMGKDVLRKCF